MPTPVTELDEELEDSFDPVTEEDEEYEDESYDESQPSPRSALPRVNPLQSTVDSLTGEVAELKNRLGNAVRVHGEEKKKLQDEIDSWLDKTFEWQETERKNVHAKGFAEGVKSVEDRLLPLLLPEDKGVYLEGLRGNPLVPSPLQPVAPAPRRQRTQEATEDLSVLVASFTAQGVPLDEIEQTSAKAVVDSATRYLKAQIAEAKEQASSATNQAERAEREASGALRVPNGASSARPARVNNDAEQLKRIEVQLKKLRDTRPVNAAEQAAPLLREKRQILERISRRR